MQQGGHCVCVFLLQEPKCNKVDIVCVCFYCRSPSATRWTLCVCVFIAGAQVQQGSSRAAVPWHA